MKLVCFYDIEKYKNQDRVFSPATATVIDYIADSLYKLNIPVEIISPAETRKTSGRFPKRSEMIRKGIVLTECASTGYKRKIFRIMSKCKSRLWLVNYLLKNTKKNEIVFFWDSPVLYEPLMLFRMFDKKNVKILYFASEFYEDVLSLGRLKCRMERKLFNDADMLLVSTKLLDEKINQSGKKSIILHGTYNSVPKFEEKFADGLIHIIYAGVINSHKGSSKAVEIASHLSADYHINIIGYGKEDDVDELKKNIKKSNEVNECKISYDGVLFGEEYYRYLQKCDIGLCSQDSNAKYNESSFPSKILSYMANGLRVVSVDLIIVRNSEIGDMVYFTSSDSAEDFAKAIVRIDVNKKYDSRTAIAELDAKFVRDLEILLKNQVVR